MAAPDVAIKFCRAARPRILKELEEFVRFPSVSAQSQHTSDVRRCARWLATHLQQLGFKTVEVVPTARHPIVYAESRQISDRPTVLVYGHYDVQPADPLVDWRSPPFEPIVHGANLYGRGACDDKGQLFAHVKAIEAYFASAGSLPVNVKCLFEGEEEIGSPNLPAFLASNRQRLCADVALLSDTPMVAPNRPAITYAMRGALSVELEVKSSKRDLHSGIFGGAVHNPLQVLCEMLATLHNQCGRITIPGFYDAVREWGPRERAYMAATGPDDTTLLCNAGVQTGWGELGFSGYERTTIRPALAVNGIVGGYQGEGAKAVIPNRAAAKLNFRLVPDQTPQGVARLFRAHIARIAPPTIDVTVRNVVEASPAMVDRGHPVMRAAVSAYHKGFGARPVFLRSGGTIPVVNMLQRALDVPVVLMGFALPDDRMHAPNEKFHLPNLFNGIETSIWFLAELVMGPWITERISRAYRFGPETA